MVTLTLHVSKYEEYKLHQQYIPKRDIWMMEFMYLVFTRTPCESYRTYSRIPALIMTSLIQMLATK